MDSFLKGLCFFKFKMLLHDVIVKFYYKESLLYIITISVRSHIESERPEPGPYKCMLTLTSKTRLKPWGGTWVEARWLVDWEAKRGQYLTRWVCCAILKDAFWGYAWLPRTNPWGGPGWKPWTWVDWEAQSGQYLASEVGCYN